MNRRGFIGSILAAATAPAIAKSGILMPVKSLVEPTLILWGDGVHDDTRALQAFFDGRVVRFADGKKVCGLIQGKILLVNEPVVIGRHQGHLVFNDNCIISGPLMQVRQKPVFLVNTQENA